MGACGRKNMVGSERSGFDGDSQGARHHWRVLREPRDDSGAVLACRKSARYIGKIFFTVAGVSSFSRQLVISPNPSPCGVRHD